MDEFVHILLLPILNPLKGHCHVHEFSVSLSPTELPGIDHLAPRIFIVTTAATICAPFHENGERLTNETQTDRAHTTACVKPIGV